MKKTAKILIGVLSVGALIGTGYATWHISGGFTGDEATLTPGVETVVDKNFGYIEVTAVDGDDFITFDGDANDDLTISYMVKAFPNKGSDRNPYDLKNYEGIANEYIPNLKVETIVKEGDAELGKDDSFFKYVDLPSSTAIDYKTRLASEYKDTGYKVTLNFSWSKETLGGQNPELAWKGLSTSEQQANYDSLIDALSNVKFTFKFIVGNDDGVTEEPDTPVTPTEGEWVDFDAEISSTPEFTVTKDDGTKSFNVKYTNVTSNSYKNIVATLPENNGYNHVKFVVTNNGTNVVNGRVDVNDIIDPNTRKSLNLTANKNGEEIRTDLEWGGSFFELADGETATIEITFAGNADELMFYFDTSISGETTTHSGDVTISNIQFAFIDDETEEPVEPVVTTTGEITLPTIEGSTLTIDGLNDGKVEVGTHKISLSVTGENQFLNDNTITIYKTIGNDTTSEPLELKETTATTRTVGLLYSADYTFEKDVIYSFDYKLATTFFFKDLSGLNYVGTDGYVYAWNGETKNAEFPGVKIEHVSWDAAGDGANLYTFNLVTSDYTNIILSTGEFKSDDQGKSYFHKVSQTVDISLENFDSSKNLYALTGAKDGDKYVGEFVNYDEYFSDIAVISTKFDDTLGKVEFTKRLYREGDTVELRVTPNENYEVASVTLNSGTNIEPINGIYPFTAVAGKNEVVVDFKEIGKEENYSISQITTEGEYTVRGVVVAKDNNSILIHDGSDGILAYDKKLDANVGDYVTINGGLRTYNKLYQFAYNATPAVNIVEVLNDENAPTLPEAKELTNEDLLRWKEATALTTKDVQLYKWNATCVDNNGHLGLNLTGSDINISPTSSEFTSDLKEGYEYSVEAYFIGYSNESDYVSVMLTEKPTLIEKDAASVEIVSEKTEIKMNEEVNLSFTSNPELTTNTPKWSSSNENVATVSQNGTVLGVAPGEAEITLELVNSNGEVTAKDTLTIKVNNEVADLPIYSLDLDPNNLVKEQPSGSAYGNGLDSSKAYNLLNYDGNDFISEILTANNLYSDSNLGGIRFGKGSGAGVLSFKINTTKYSNISKIKMTIVPWSGDKVSICAYRGTVEDPTYSEAFTGVPTSPIEFDLTGQEGDTITISTKNSSKSRFVLTSLEFYK